MAGGLCCGLGLGFFWGGGGLFFSGQFQGNQLQKVIGRRLLPTLKSEIHSGHCYPENSCLILKNRNLESVSKPQLNREAVKREKCTENTVLKPESNITIVFAKNK